MNKLLLILFLTVTVYPRILMAIPEPEKDIQTVFNYDHVQLFFHNRFVWKKDDRIETLTYEQYISKRTGCIDFTVLGLQKSNHESMRIMISCHDKDIK